MNEDIADARHLAVLDTIRRLTEVVGESAGSLHRMNERLMAVEEECEVEKAWGNAVALHLDAINDRLRALEGGPAR